MSGKKENFLRYYYKNRDKILFRKKKHYQRNKKEIQEKKLKYYHENKDKTKNRKFLLFSEAAEGYGGKCLFCGEDRLKGLVFHHVNGDGKKHREETGMNIPKFHRWIVENDFPDEIVLLCGTCHLILHRTYG